MSLQLNASFGDLTSVVGDDDHLYQDIPQQQLLWECLKKWKTRWLLLRIFPIVAPR